VHIGPQKVLSVALQPNRTYTIGTDPRSDIRLPASPESGKVEVGFQHARLTVRPSRVLFHHLAEGVYSLVNGEPATWSLLEPGDRLGIGPYQCSYEALPLDEATRTADADSAQRPARPGSSVA
jgi:pSer/pThr/pTyr-binding forkhead associated (FHA) protein